MTALEIRAACHIGMNGMNPLCVSGVITSLSAARYRQRYAILIFSSLGCEAPKSELMVSPGVCLCVCVSGA